MVCGRIKPVSVARCAVDCVSEIAVIHMKVGTRLRSKLGVNCAPLTLTTM